MSDVPSQQDQGNSGRLEGWKEIAAYLGVTPRCAQRWEREDGLPVRRIGTRVYADKHELDAWRQARAAGPRLPAGAEVADICEPALPEKVPSAAQRHRSTGILIAAAVSLSLVMAVVWFGRPAKLSPPSIPSVRPYPRFLWQATAEGGAFQRIPLSESPLRLDVSPDGSKVYILSRSRPLLMVADADRLTARSVSLPGTPRSIRVSADGRTIYLGSNSDGVMLFDTKKEKVSEVIPTDGPVSDIAITPDGRKLFLAMMHRGVRRLDLHEREWRQLTTQGCPYFVSLDRLGTRLLVSYQCGGPTGRDGHDAIELFDTKTERSLDVFSGPPLVGGKHEFSPDGSLIWLSGLDACRTPAYDHHGCSVVPSTVSHFFRPADRRIVKSLFLPLFLGGHPQFAPDGSRVLLTEGGIAQIDTSNSVFLERYHLKDDAYVAGNALSPDGRRAYIARPDSKDLIVLSSEEDRCTQLPPGLVHQFTGDGTGQDAIESPVVTPSDALQFRPGFIGQAFDLEGNRKLQIDWRSDLQFGSTESTLSLYLKLGGDSGPVLDWHDPDTKFRWTLSIEENAHLQYELRQAAGDPLRVLSAKPVLPGIWSHVAVTVNAREIALYVDGIPAGSASLSDRRPHGRAYSRTLRLGWSTSSSSVFSGLIDELAFWTRDLRREEVWEMYDRRTKPPCKP